LVCFFYYNKETTLEDIKDDYLKCLALTGVIYLPLIKVEAPVTEEGFITPKCDEISISFL
jgi:hypothetical protein